MGSVVEGVFGFLGAQEQASAARGAANASAGAQNYATDVQRNIFEQQRSDQEPWRAAGGASVNRLAQYLGVAPLESLTSPGERGIYGSLTRPFSMADYRADPGYQFRLSEGMNAIQNSAAARGNLLSGGTLKGITRYGQDAASQEYGNAYNRYNQNQGNTFNRLSGLSGTGQTAVNQLGQAGQNFAGNVGNIGMTNAANQGNAALVGANARASAYQGIGNALGRINWGGFGGSGGGFGGGYDPNTGIGNTSVNWGM